MCIFSAFCFRAQQEWFNWIAHHVIMYVCISEKNGSLLRCLLKRIMRMTCVEDCDERIESLQYIVASVSEGVNDKHAI